MDLTALNQAQYDAVTARQQYIRVIAGAGTGKTRVLTMRLAYLIENYGVAPEKICTITYTNKATNEMKKRIGELLPVGTASPHISTIHSLCVTILRQDIRYLDWPTNFTVMDQDDMRSLIREACQVLNYEFRSLPLTTVLNYIAAKKYQRLDYDTIVAQTHGEPLAVQMAAIYNYYVCRQNEMFALDFDDLIAQTHHLFTAFPVVLAKWQKRFQFYLVDEFQDVENTQYEILQMLARGGNDVFIVGDPDQTIYTFRGANIDLIMDFPQDFSPCTTITLTQNYRSTPLILKAANSVISHNHMRIEKELTAVLPDGPKLLHYTAESSEKEAEWVSQQILQLQKGGLPLHEIAILYRANYLSRPFEKSLMAQQLPYVMYGGIRFFDRAEVKDMLCYLRMMTSADDLALRRIINIPPRQLGTKTMDALFVHARQTNQTMYEAIPSFTAAPAVHHRLLKFREMIETFKATALTMTPDKLLENIFIDSGYRQMLTQKAEDERMENISELISDCNDFFKTFPDSTLDEYLQMTSTITSKQPETNGEYIQMSTCHMAKGLEFDTVFLVGLSEGAFPSNQCIQDGPLAMEEERRLFYVALTRAKYRLCLTESQNYSPLLMQAKLPSRFIDEIDPSCIVHTGSSFILNNLRPLAENNALSQDQTMLASPWKIGDRVNHPIFGSGVVIRCSARAIDVDFGNQRGTKSFTPGHPSLTKDEQEKK